MLPTLIGNIKFTEPPSTYLITLSELITISIGASMWTGI